VEFDEPRTGRHLAGFPPILQLADVETLRITWQAHEEVVLRLVDGDFPTWRNLAAQQHIEATETTSFSAGVLSSLGQLAGLYRPVGRVDTEWRPGSDRLRPRAPLGPLMPARPVAAVESGGS
jgi:hypothetical protein